MRLTCSGDRVIEADWVIAADGARSAVRRSLGIAMEGHRSPRFHVVIDVADLPDRPRLPERVFHYHHPRTDGRHVLFAPFAGGFQMDVQCLVTDRPEDVATREVCPDWLDRLVGPGHGEQILWVSSYHFQQRVARTFADPSGRVLLAGEAAHLFPPFGARGMNSGIADADEVAEVVAALYHGGGGDTGSGAYSGTATAIRVAPARARELVERYDRVRRQAALRNQAAAARALAHLFRGSYAGGMPGATAAPGTKVEFGGSDVLRVTSGRFSEYWVSSDGVSLMNQLGVGA